MTAQALPQRWRTLGGAVLIVIVTVYAYGNSTRGPFIFDDRNAIVDNPFIRSLWPITQSLHTPDDASTGGRPLPQLSFAINYHFSRLNPFAWHVTNIAIHAACAIMLLLTLQRLLRRLNHPAVDAIALCTSLLWAVHPLLTEAVTYSSNRIEEMMSLFVLCSLYTFLRFQDGRRPKIWMAASILCALAAALSKEEAAMLPPLAYFIDAMAIARSWRRPLAERWQYYLLLIACTWGTIALLLSSTAIGVRIGSADRVPAWNNLLMQSQVITHYLRLAVWPAPLVVCYSDWATPSSLREVWPTMAFIGGLFITTAALLFGKKPVGLIGAWFFLILGPTSSVLPIMNEPAAERRMYLPLAAIVLLATLAVERLTRAWRGRGLMAIVLTLLLVLGLSQVTLLRNDDYATDLSLWADTVSHRPGNAFAQASLGGALMMQGDLQDALPCLDRALTLQPGMANAMMDRGLVRIGLGQADAGLADLRACAAAQPNLAMSWAALGLGYEKLGRLPEAEQALRRALQLAPGYPLAQELLDHPVDAVTTQPPAR